MEDELLSQSGPLEPVPSRAGPPRSLFISYGRADALDFAKRLAADLDARGYPVWVDLQCIEAGGLWEVRIEQGIRGAAVVLAVMTPHSLREDSPCRDEIVFALNEGKKVVPVRTDPAPSVKPTLLLARRNWVDFTPGYEQGLAALLCFLDGDSSALLPPVLAAVTGVAPLDFGPEIARYSADFIGRSWLADELDAWLGRSGQRLLLIAGSPGMGKSAIVAWLSLTRSDVVGVHFCTQRNTRSLNPYELVASLVCQLHARLPGYAALVEKCEPERRRPTAADAFRELVVEPARQLASPSAARLLLVDALDEAFIPGGETVVDVLAEQAPDLPPWLRVVATSRPESGVLERVRSLGLFELHADSTHNRQDLDHFLRARLSTAGLRERIGDQVEAVAARLAQLAEGNFLYARLALTALEEGSLSLEDVGSLSSGLTRFYSTAFRRRFPGPDDYRGCAALLRALAVARGPLSFGLLQRITGLDAETLHRRLRGLRAYLRAHGAGPSSAYALFHKSLRDWLSDAEAAGDYWCDPVVGHAQLAGALRDSWRDDYALRHLCSHLAAAGLFDDLAGLLRDLPFLEARAKAGLVFDLSADLSASLNLLPAAHAALPLLRLLDEALRRDIHFIARHPETLFACLWNSCWWYDCPRAADHYDPPEGGWPAEGPPWQRRGPHLHSLLEKWRIHKKTTTPGMRWFRSLRPPPHPLGTAQRAVLRGHEGAIADVAVSADGRRIASASKDRTVRVWDLASGAEVLCLRGHSDWVQSVAFFPDSRRLVSASSDRTLRVWDAASGLELACLRGHREKIWDIAVSPDGQRLVSGGEDWTVRFWDVASGTEVRCCRLRGVSEHGAAISVAFAPDGRRALTGLADGTVVVWDVAGTGAPLRLAGHAGMVCGVAFSPDGRRIASAGAEGAVKVWDADRLVELACLRAQNCRQTGISRLAFSPDGRRLVWGTGDDAVRIWDVDARTELACLRGHDDGVCAVKFAAEGRLVVSASFDGTVRIWQAVGCPLPPRLRGHQAPIRTLAFSPDGRLLASGSNSLRIWDAVLGTQLLRLVEEEGVVRSVAFAPDGSHLAAGTEDGTIRLWSLPDGAPRGCLRGNLGAVLCLAFSPDGLLLASGSWDGRCRIWDAVGGGERACLTGHTDRVIRVGFSADASRIVSHCADGTTRAWDVGNGALLEQIVNVAPAEPSRWRATGLEAAVITPEEKEVWLAASPELIQAHPSGRIWAGASGSYLHLLMLEGLWSAPGW